MSDPEMVEVVQVDATMTDTMAVAKNAATNGRLFSAMLFALCLMTFAMTRENIYAAMALFAAVPVGLAVLIDQLPATAARTWAVLANYALPIAVAICFLISLG